MTDNSSDTTCNTKPGLYSIIDSWCRRTDGDWINLARAFTLGLIKLMMLAGICVIVMILLGIMHLIVTYIGGWVFGLIIFATVCVIIGSTCRDEPMQGFHYEEDDEEDE